MRIFPKRPRGAACSPGRGGGRRGGQGRGNPGKGLCRRNVAPPSGPWGGRPGAAREAPRTDQARQGTRKAQVDTRLCRGCGRCLKACPKGAIALSGGKAVIAPERCVACGACVVACPQQAITLSA